MGQAAASVSFFFQIFYEICRERKRERLVLCSLSNSLHDLYLSIYAGGLN